MLVGSLGMRMTSIRWGTVLEETQSRSTPPWSQNFRMRILHCPLDSRGAWPAQMCGYFVSDGLEHIVCAYVKFSIKHVSSRPMTYLLPCTYPRVAPCSLRVRDLGRKIQDLWGVRGDKDMWPEKPLTKDGDAIKLSNVREHIGRAGNKWWPRICVSDKLLMANLCSRLATRGTRVFQASYQKKKRTMNNQNYTQAKTTRECSNS